MTISFVRMALAFALFLPASSALAANTFYYYTPATGIFATSTVWTNLAFWNATPVSSLDTAIVFGTAGKFSDVVGNTNTNNYSSPVDLNVLTFRGSSADYSGASITVQGGTLNFVKNSSAEGPQINLDFRNGLSAPATMTVDSQISLTDSVTFTGDGNGTFIFAGVISGAGGITKTGSSSLNLIGGANTNTYTGGTTISGGLVRFASGAAFGTGNITIDGGGIEWADGLTEDISSRLNPLGANGATFVVSSGNVTLASVLSGGALTKTNGGTLTLTAANTYTGATSVVAGTLAISGAGRLSNSSSVSVSAGAALSYIDVSDTIGSLSGAGAVDLGSGTLTVGNATSTSYSGVFTGAGGLNKIGTGTLTLSGSSSYTGGTTISGGLVRFSTGASLGTGNITLDGGGLQWATGNTTDISARLNPLGASGTTFDTNGNNVTLASALTGSGGSVIKTGAGTLTLTGANTYAGTTTVSGGALQIGNGSTSGSLVGGIVNNTSVVFNRSDAVTYGGAISGTGSLTKLGAGNLTLGGSNTYTGGNTVSAGTLTGSTSSLPGSIVNDAAVVFNQAVDGTTEGLISGSGSLTKTGAGVLTLTNSNTYTGATTIAGGTIRLASGSSVGTAMLLDATSIAATASPVTTWADLSGNGNNAGAGGGSVTLGTLSTGRAALVFGNNSYFDTALSSSGSGYTMFSVFEPTTLSGNQTIAGSSQNGGLQFRVADNRLGLLSQGLAQLANSNTITNTSPTFATASITSGAQSFYLGTTAAGTGNATYAFSPGANFRIGSNAQVNESFNGKISLFVVYKSVLTPAQIATVQSAILASLANGTTFADPNVTIDGSLPGNTTLNITASGAALDLNGRTQTVGSLAGVAGSHVILGGSGQLTAGGNNTSTTYAGSIEGAGSFTKAGTGTLTLSGVSTFQGPLTVNGGTLALSNANTFQGNITVNNSSTLAVGNDSSLGDSANVVTLNGTTLVTNAALALPQLIQFGASGGTINTNGFNSTAGSGLGTIPGAFVKSGNGNLTLGGNSTTTALGSVSISAGSLSIPSGSTLRIGNAGTSGSINTGSVAVNGALVFDRSDSFSNTVTLTGSGTLTKLGNGTATLVGVQNFSGTTSITGGLTFSNPISTTSTLSGNITGGSLTKTDSGTLVLSGTNSFTSVTFTGGAIVAGSDGALGSAPLIFNGSGRLGTTVPRTISNPMTVSGNAIFDPGLTLSGPIALAGSPVLSPTTTGSVILSGVISGNSGLGFSGSLGSAIILSGTNSYTGVTTLTGGAIVGIYDDAGLGAAGGSVNILNGTLRAMAPLALNRSFPGGAVLDTNGFDSTLTGSTFAISVSGAGSLTYLGTSSPIVFTAAGSTLKLGAGGVVSGWGSVFNSGTLEINHSNNFTSSVAMSGTGGLIKSGTGTLTLTGASSYSGGTTISGGALAFSTAGNLGTGPVTLNGAELRWTSGSTTDISSKLVIGAAGGSLTLDAPAVTFATSVTGSGPVTLNTTGTLTLTAANAFPGLLTIARGTVQVGPGGSISGPIANNGNLIFNRADAVTQASVISGTGAVAQNGAGALTLSGANTNSGGFALNAGTTIAANDAAFSTGPVALNGGVLQSSGGLRTIGNAVSLNADTTISGANALTLAGSVTLNGFKMLTVTNTAQTTISGAIGESSPSILIKLGAGELQLTGANTYTAGTYIGAGTVRINNTTGSAFGTGAVTIAPGAILAGNGSFTGALQLNGIYSPGNSPGIANTGAQNWAGGAGYVWELNNASDAPGAKGVSYDWMNIGGPLSIDSTSDNKFTIYVTSLTSDNAAGLTPGFVIGQTYQWTIATATSPLTSFSADKFLIDTSAFVNDSANLGHFAIVQSLDGLSLNLTYTAVPEPSTYAIGIVALLGGIIFLRRRSTR